MTTRQSAETTKAKRNMKARAIVLEHLQGGGSLLQACKLARISRQTPHNWQKRGDIEMREAMQANRRRAPKVMPPDDHALIRGALRAVLSDRDASPFSKVRAAKALAALPQPVAAPVRVTTGKPLGTVPELPPPVDADALQARVDAFLESA